MIPREIYCITNKCTHFKSVSKDTWKEEGVNRLFKYTCNAFPSGIPKVIRSGEDEHLHPLANQKNKIIFEK